MRERPKASVSFQRPSAASTWWFGLMGASGFGFGLIGDRRPFGQDVLLHPLAVFFILVGVGLVVLRIAAARPVPKFIPDRALLIGCVIGLAAFLVGNFVAIYWLTAQ